MITATDQDNRFHWLDILVLFLLFGNLVMSRAFAHWGIGSLYVGEICLLVLLFVNPQPISRMILSAQIRPTPLSWFAWMVLLSLVFGFLQFVRGIAFGHDMGVTIQNIVFHIYPLFFFAAIWVGIRNQNLMPEMIRRLAWVNAIYGCAHILFYHRTDGGVVGVEVGWIGAPIGQTVVVLGLLCYERSLRSAWIPFCLNVFVLIGRQGRSEWVGLLAAIVLWGLLARRMRVVAHWGLAALAAIVLFMSVDIALPIRDSDNVPLTTHGIVGFAIAAVDEGLAREFTDSADNYSSTVSWRTGWWRRLWEMVHEDSHTAILGPGYGFPIWEYHEESLDNYKLRTPHNSVMYAMSYTGWSGLLIFGMLQISLLVILWHAYRLTGQPFGICCWVMMCSRSLFSPFFETPYQAIPFFLLLGLAAAPLIAPLSSRETEPNSPPEGTAR